MTRVAPMPSVCQRTRGPSVPVLQAPDQILCPRLAAPPSTPAPTTHVTDLPSADPQPLASVVCVLKVRWEILTSLDVSQKAVVPMVTEIVQTRAFVSVADVRMFVMMDVVPTPSAPSATDRPSASVWLDSSPVPWTPGPVSETVRCAHVIQTVWVAARVSQARVGTRVVARTTVWWVNSVVRACV